MPRNPAKDSRPSFGRVHLDFSSAFVKQAKASAAARAPKTKDKTTTTTTTTSTSTTTTSTDRHRESQPLKAKGQKRIPRLDSSQYESHPPPKHKPSRHQGRNYRKTSNRGPPPSHSRVAAGINDSAPVISNGYESPVIEEDDLSPVDMSQAQYYEVNIPQSKMLAGEGNKAAKAGDFEEAVRKYSDAIELYPFDHRYLGNRSFCYDYLQDYSKALSDANSALRIDITWAKGFYRRGRGLAGLKRYEAAVVAFSRALELNPEYTEAQEQLEAVQLEQLQSMGFPVEISKVALAEHHTVAAAVDALVNRAGGSGSKKQQNCAPVYNHSGFEIPPRMLPQTASPQKCALWVGNITTRSFTQNMITTLFQKYGTVASIRVLYERRCAFVNYTRPESAAAALKKLQGYNIAGCSLLVRYPDKSPPVPKSSPRASAASTVEECHFWRTTGCSYGDQCHFLHLPESRGVDRAAYRDNHSQ